MAFRVSFTIPFIVLLLAGCNSEEPERPFRLSEVHADELLKVSEEIHIGADSIPLEVLPGEIPSPDGKLLAVVDTVTIQERKASIISVREFGTNSGGKGIDTVQDCYDLAWSPDGSKLVYSDGTQVHIADADGGTRQVIYAAQKHPVPVICYNFTWQNEGHGFSFVQREETEIADSLRNAMLITITLGQAQNEEEGGE